MRNNSRRPYQYLLESQFRSSDHGSGLLFNGRILELEDQLACTHWQRSRQSLGWYMLCWQRRRLQSRMAMTICRWKCWTGPFNLVRHIIIWDKRQTPQRVHRVP